MMAGGRTLRVTITGDSKGAQKSVVELEQKTEGFGKKVGGALGGVGKIAGGFVVGSALTQLPGILMDGAKGAVEDQAAMDKLQQAVTNTGANYDQYGGQIDAAIARGQELAFTDGETADALSTLVALTGSTEEGMARLSAAQDLARGTGMDLQTAAKLLGKTSDENTAALSRYGIQLGDNATAQDVLNAVDSKFGGQAGTFAESDAGKLLKAQQATGELAESFGSFLIPAMLLASQVATKIGEALTTHVLPKVQSLIGSLSGLTAFMQGNFQPILIGVLAAVVAGFVAWAISAGAAALATIVAMAPVIAVVAAVGLAAALLFAAWQSNFLGIQDIVSAVWGVVQPILQAIIDRIQEFVSTVLPELIQAWENVRTQVAAAIEAISSVVQAVFGAIQGFIQTHGDTIQAILQGAWTLIQGHIDMVINVIQGIILAVLKLIQGDWEGAWNEIKGIGETIWGQIQLVVDTAINLIKGIVDRVLDEIKELWDTAWGALKGIVSEKLGEAQTAVQGGIDDIKGLFSGAASWLLQAGRDIVQGLIDGMGELLQSVKNKAAEIADAAKNAVTGALGIDSPSKVMIELGRWTAKGFAVGLEQGQSDVEKAANKMAAIAALSPGTIAKNIGMSYAPNLTPAGPAGPAMTVVGGRGAGAVLGHATNSPFMPHDPYREANVSIELDGRVLARSTSRRLTNNHRFTATTGSGRLP